MGQVLTSRRDEVRNEVGFRDRNETIQRQRARFAPDGEPHAFICECGDAACERAIGLTQVEYEAVRSSATRFALALNHENPETEYVVSESASFAVVEKVGAATRHIIRHTDPRRTPARSDP